MGSKLYRRKIQRRGLPKPSATLAKTQRISHRDLPADVGTAFKRVSQIYGIPLKELTPFWRKSLPAWQRFVGWDASYDTGEHLVAGKMTPAKLAHESWHSLQNLLSEREKVDFAKKVEMMAKMEKKRPVRGKDIWDSVRFFPRSVIQIRRRASKFVEPTADINVPVLKIWRSVRFKEGLLIVASSFFQPALYLAIGSVAIGVARRYLAQSFFKKHGVDGLLLIFAFPPKKWEVLRIKSHEKKLIQQGFLKEHGGMTKKGIQMLRELVPRELVLKRAKSFNL